MSIRRVTISDWTMQLFIKDQDLFIWIEENSYYSSKGILQGVKKTIKRRQNYKGHEGN
jgi:hypothetical protein